jgi:RNA polymerase sigma-70 factor (ECF subfamily)
LCRFITERAATNTVLLCECKLAVRQEWCRDGIPGNPRAWIVSTARFKAIDAIGRRARFDKTVAEHGSMLALSTIEIEDFDEETFKDDHLRLIFTCCHPALSPNAQIALTLR